MASVGKPGDPNMLSDKLKEMEVPSGRKSVSEIAMEDSSQLNTD